MGYKKFQVVCEDKVTLFKRNFTTANRPDNASLTGEKTDSDASLTTVNVNLQSGVTRDYMTHDIG